MGDAIEGMAEIQLKDIGGGFFGSKAAPDLPASITLTGSGFGSSGATVTMLDEFAYSDADGTPIPDGVGTPYRDNTIPSNNQMVVDRTVALAGRSGSMRGKTKCQIMPQMVKSTEIYVSWFQSWDVDLEDPLIFTTNARSDKLLRVWDNDLVGNTRISWTKQHVTFEDPLGSSPIYGPIRNVGLVSVFQRFEIYAQKGVGFQTYINGDPFISTTDFGDNYPADGLYPEMFGYDMADQGHIQQGKTFNTNVAEIVALDGRARVEFSNTPTWGLSGNFKRYRQPHSTWADGSIVISTPFYCDLDVGEGNIYAHIVKSDGSVIDYGAVN